MSASRLKRLTKIRNATEDLENALLNLRRFGGDDTKDADDGFKAVYYLERLAKRALPPLKNGNLSDAIGLLKKIAVEKPVQERAAAAFYRVRQKAKIMLAAIKEGSGRVRRAKK